MVKATAERLQFNVSQLLKATVGSERYYYVKGLICIDEASSPTGICGDISLTRTKRSILVETHLHTKVELTCSRCLRSFNQGLDLNMKEEFFPTADVTTGRALVLPEDEPDRFTIDQNHIMDLTEAIRQYAIMATPMKPLCAPDCEGIRY